MHWCQFSLRLYSCWVAVGIAAQSETKNTDWYCMHRLYFRFSAFREVLTAGQPTFTLLCSTNLVPSGKSIRTADYFWYTVVLSGDTDLTQRNPLILQICCILRA